jgi:hypothetical protein
MLATGGRAKACAVAWCAFRVECAEISALELPAFVAERCLQYSVCLQAVTFLRRIKEVSDVFVSSPATPNAPISTVALYCLPLPCKPVHTQAVTFLRRIKEVVGVFGAHPQLTTPLINLQLPTPHPPPPDIGSHAGGDLP